MPIRLRLDLTGQVCPYPFVKSMLALEQMNIGDELEIVLDYPPAAISVPRSLKVYGHQVKEIVEAGDRWLLVIRKGQVSW